MMDEYLKNELKPYFEELIALGLRPFLAETLQISPLMENPTTYDLLIRITVNYLRSFDLSDDARFVICLNLDYYQRVRDEAIKTELRKVVRSHWLEIAEVYRNTPDSDLRRKYDVEPMFSQVKQQLPLYLDKEYSNENREVLLDLLRDTSNGDSRSILLWPLKRRKKSKWVQEFLKEIRNDMDIGEEVRELILE